MQSISVFLGITKFADFRWKNADVSRTQGVCHVIHIFFECSLGKVKLPSFIIVGYLWQILGRGDLFGPSIREQPRKCPSWIRVRVLTGKKYSDAFEKYEYEHLVSWYIKSTLYTRFLNWNKIFKKIK